MIRRPPRSTLFPYTDALPISLCWPDPSSRSFRRKLRQSGSTWKKAARRCCSSIRTQIRRLTTCCTHGVFSLARSEEHTSELQSLTNLVCRLLLEKKKKKRMDSAGIAPSNSDCSATYESTSLSPYHAIGSESACPCHCDNLRTSRSRPSFGRACA